MTGQGREEGREVSERVSCGDGFFCYTLKLVSAFEGGQKVLEGEQAP